MLAGPWRSLWKETEDSIGGTARQHCGLVEVEEAEKAFCQISHRWAVERTEVKRKE